jgi:hypothetical protein
LYHNIRTPKCNCKETQNRFIVTPELAYIVHCRTPILVFPLKNLVYYCSTAVCVVHQFSTW